MTDNGGQWERDLVARLATAALKEQRRARLWGIFFKLLTFAYVTFLLLVAFDWEGGADMAGGRKHTAMVEVSGLIAPGSDASAERVNTALLAAFKDKNTQGVVVRINSPGGSATASEAILLALRKLSDAKPVVISMGSRMITTTHSGLGRLRTSAESVWMQSTRQYTSSASSSHCLR